MALFGLAKRCLLSTVSVCFTTCFAHDIHIEETGTISISCDNGSVAVGRIIGTEIYFEVTEKDGSKFGLVVSPSAGSGGAPDPALSIHVGKSLADDACSGSFS